MRIILIDNNSGYIFGDTADFAAGVQVCSVEHAAKMLHDSINGVSDRSYTLSTRNPNIDATGYDCYRADIDGSEAVPVVHDGQDADTINAVINLCKHVGFVAVKSNFVS